MSVDQHMLAVTLYYLEDEVRRTGFQVHWIAGKTGACHHWAKFIEMGLDYSLSEKVITLAHELGHIVDKQRNHPDVEELVLILKFWHNYKLGEKYLAREKNAWRYAREALLQTNIWSDIRKEFYRIKASSLQAYRRQHLAAKKQGKDQHDKGKLKEILLQLISEASQNEATTNQG